MGCGAFLEQASSLPSASAPFHCPPIPNNAPPHATFPTGGTLVWQDNTAVNYSNWGPPGLGPSMLSHNSCYWIQSSSGLWRPGACTNITMGVVCKLPRGAGDIWCWGAGGPGPLLILQATQWMGGSQQAWGRRDPPLGSVGLYQGLALPENCQSRQPLVDSNHSVVVKGRDMGFEPRPNRWPTL